MNWYIDVLKKYDDFSGRASRKEYWMFILFSIIIGGTLDFIVDTVFHSKLFGNICQQMIMFLSISAAVRRLHDTGRSGWWFLLPIVNLVFLLQGSQHGDNKYGSNPDEQQQRWKIS